MDDWWHQASVPWIHYDPFTRLIFYSPACLPLLFSLALHVVVVVLSAGEKVKSCCGWKRGGWSPSEQNPNPWSFLTAGVRFVFLAPAGNNSRHFSTLRFRLCYKTKAWLVFTLFSIFNNLADSRASQRTELSRGSMFKLMEPDTRWCWMLILTAYTVIASSQDLTWTSEMLSVGKKRLCRDRDSARKPLRQPRPGSFHGCRFVGRSPVKIKCCFSGKKRC